MSPKPSTRKPLAIKSRWMLRKRYLANLDVKPAVKSWIIVFLLTLPVEPTANSEDFNRFRVKRPN